MDSFSFKKEILSQSFSEKTMRLTLLLEKHYSDKRLSDIVKGVERVLSDPSNPDRLHQAANSIRELSNIMNRYDGANSIQLDESSEKKVLDELIQNPILAPHVGKMNPEQLQKYFQGLKKAIQSSPDRNRDNISNTLEKLAGVPDEVFKILEAGKIKSDAVSRWHALVGWFVGITHHRKVQEREFLEKWTELQSIIERTLSGGFDFKAEVLDSLLAENQPNTSHLSSLKPFFLSSPIANYVFSKLNNLTWFDPMKESGFFFEIPSTEKNEHGEEFWLPWHPGTYLTQIADKIPKKVAMVLQNIRTENPMVIGEAMRAILKMPDTISKTLLPKVDEWLNCLHYSGYEALELLASYVREKKWEEALELFEILLKVKWDEKMQKTTFRADRYQGMALLKDKGPTGLLNEKPMKVADIAWKALKHSLEMDVDQKKKKRDFSAVWRPAIEKHGNHGYPDDVLTTLLRDALENASKNSAYHEKIDLLLKDFLSQDFSIFKRIAMHVLRVMEASRDLIRQILNNPRIHYNDNTRHEFLKLADEKFPLLDQSEQIKFLDWLETPLVREDFLNSTDQDFKSYQEYEAQKNLKKVPEIVKTSLGLQEKLDRLKAQRPILDRNEGTASWGNKSSLNEDEILKKTPEEFLQYVRTFRPDLSHIRNESTPDALSRTFQRVVEKHPEKYAQTAPQWLNRDNIYPTYVAALLWGLKLACREGRSFSIEPILKLAEGLLKTWDWDPAKNDGDLKWFHLGTFSWARGNLANLFEELANQNIFPLEKAQILRMQDMLMDLISKDPDPDPSEAEEKTDPVQRCINCNRGKAMHALILVALRWARDNENLKAGDSRFVPSVKDFLTARLREENDPAVQSVFGTFLPNLSYLDGAWMKEQIRNGGLFPKASPGRFQIWKAHMKGFLFHAQFYRNLFELLKPDFKKAIKELTYFRDEGENLYPNRVAEFVMLAFYEKLEDGESLVEQLFETRHEETCRHAIEFVPRMIGGSMEAEKEEDRKVPPWTLLFDFWKKRVNENTRGIGAFAKWLEKMPDSCSLEKDLLPLLKPIVPHLYSGFLIEDLLKFLDSRMKSEPVPALQILVELLNTSSRRRAELHWYGSDIQSILEKAKLKAADLEIKDLVNSIVNRFGELEFYTYREFFIR